MNFKNIKNITELLIKRGATEERDTAYRVAAETVYGAVIDTVEHMLQHNEINKELMIDESTGDFWVAFDVMLNNLDLGDIIYDNPVLEIDIDLSDTNKGKFQYEPENKPSPRTSITLYITSAEFKQLQISSNFKEDFIDIISSKKDTIIHETIHLFDYLRYKKYLKYNDLGTSDKMLTPEERAYYINDSREFNAYYQARVQEFLNSISKDEDTLSNVLSEFNLFWEYFLVFYENIYNNLTEDNQKKIVKRLYNVYENLRDNEL